MEGFKFCGQESLLIPLHLIFANAHNYCIHSIRHHGYTINFLPILCSDYLRAVFIDTGREAICREMVTLVSDTTKLENCDLFSDVEDYRKTNLFYIEVLDCLSSIHLL